MHPRISVLLPTFRYARFLREAAGSVLAQEGADFELLIADDASGDGTAGIIRELAAEDSRIRYWIRDRNLGLVGNWNALLAEARGDYVKFVFGDDRLESPAALRRYAALLDAEPGAVLASSARTLIGEDSAPTGRRDDLGRSGRWDGAELIRRCLDQEKNLIGEPSAILFRRSAAARGFDPALRQFVDLELWLHLLRGGALVHTEEALCGFREHPAQQTVANSRTRSASVDFLVMLSRYRDCYRASPRRMFRQLYYARKASDRPPEALAAEADLLGRLGRGSYFVHWLAHRLRKPLANLQRHWTSRRSQKARLP